jgi:RNA-directed DNA polymerase
MTGKYRRQLKAWLESGVLDNEVFSETGTPQSGVISPLLANIALHGMETFLRKSIADIPVIGRTGQPLKTSRRLEALDVVRYADDFVLIHPDLSVILFLKEKIKEFLAPIGLEVSEEKTRVTHTLFIDEKTISDCPGINGKPGFNFLGFFIRQYKTPHNSARGTNKEVLGFHTIIIPSKEKRKTYQAKLHKIILKEGKGYNQDVLIQKLNPVIRGWANYFGKSDANNCHLLTKIDYLLYLKLRRWSKRVKGTTGKGKSCFRKIGNNNWTFATKKTVLVHNTDYSFPLSKYVKVRKNASPFEVNQIYWAKRLTINNTYSTRVTILLKAQKGKCKWCNENFQYDDVLEVDHVIPKSQGGKDEYSNLQLLHGHCHDTKTSLEQVSHS